MNQKIGRNDPCPCGSGKKYKQCCQSKTANIPTPAKRPMTAKWLNPPQMPDLIERTFGEAISATGKVFDAPKHKEDEKENKTEDNIPRS